MDSSDTNLVVLFGRRMKHLRLARGLSQAELADVTGVSKTTINYTERAITSPDIATLEKIARVFNTTPQQMVMVEMMNPQQPTRLRAILGSNLEYLRTERGFTRNQLAALSGMSHTYIANIEDGRNSITLDKLEKLAVALGVDPIFLITPISETNVQT